MERIIADFMAKAVLSIKKKGERRMEDFEKSRVILSNKRLLIVTKNEKTSISLQKIFDVRKIDVPDNIKDMVKDSVRIAFTKSNRSDIVVIKADGSKLDKFSYLLMKFLLKGNPVIYKHPAIKGGVLLNKEWENGLLDVVKGAIVLDRSLIKLSSIRNIKKEMRSIGWNKVDILNITVMESEESLTSWVHVPEKRIMNLLGRYIGFEYRSMLNALEKIKLSNFEKQVMQAVYSGIPVDELPLVMNMEAVEVQRIVNDLELKNLVKKGKLTPMGEVAVSRYVEGIL